MEKSLHRKLSELLGSKYSMRNVKDHYNSWLIYSSEGCNCSNTILHALNPFCSETLVGYIDSQVCHIYSDAHAQKINEVVSKNIPGMRVILH